jgi:hypothetical protein
MHARNRRTGAAITGTLETLYARCKLLEDGFGRDGDGDITHEHEGGTEFYYDTSKNVITNGERTYLDEHSEHVVESDIELYEPGTDLPKAPRQPHTATPAAHTPAKRRNDADPEAAARGVAERFIALMVSEADAWHERISAIDNDTGKDADAVENAIDEAHEAFKRNANAGIERIEVASELVDLQLARDALAPIIHHVNAAVIHIEGPNAIRLWCVRDGERFRVDEVSAREYGHMARVKPGKASAAQVDVYANAILSGRSL